jgi:hypothetical protein
VLRRKFGPRRYEEGSWRRLHNDEYNSLYSSPNIIRVIRSRRMRWVGHVACIEEGRGEVFTGLPQQAFMAWCSVKAQGQLYLYLKRFSYTLLCFNITE